jgi:hypothetical protein
MMEVITRRPAVFGFFREATHDDIVDIFVEVGERGRGFMEELVEKRSGVVEGELSRGHAVKEDAKAVDIGALVDGLAIEHLFGGAVVGSSHCAAGAGDAGGFE